MDPAVEHFFPDHHRFGMFCSRAWQDSWRENWGRHPGLKPLGSPESAEFFRYRQLKRGCIPIKTAIPAGVYSPAAPSVRCEYFCVAHNSVHPEAELQAYLDAALEYSWDQLHLPDIVDGTAECRTLIRLAHQKGLYATEQERETAYAVDLRHGTFDDYLAALGKNTRLKLFNRRKKLAREGEIKTENIWPDQDRFYELISAFHERRWGQSGYVGRNLSFHYSLLNRLAEAGHEVDLSVMTLSGEPISVCLDITAHGRCYNLQSGYVENLIKGVAVGTLHLGYQIEKAYARGAEFYDFMAGAGKNSQYKASLANTQSDFVSLRLVRNPLLKLAYRLRDARR